MEKLNRDTIKKLTRLCRIDCTEQEQDSLLVDLQKILDYIEQLDQINTDNVPPCNHVIEMQNVFREDEVGELLDRDAFLANTPAHTDGMIRVPPIMKSQGK